MSDGGKSEYGHYARNQTAEQFEANLRQYALEVRAFYDQLRVLLGSEGLAKLANLSQRLEDLTERPCLEEDDAIRERLNQAMSKELDPLTKQISTLRQLDISIRKKS